MCCGGGGGGGFLLVNWKTTQVLGLCLHSVEESGVYTGVLKFASNEGTINLSFKFLCEFYQVSKQCINGYGFFWGSCCHLTRPFCLCSLIIIIYSTCGKQMDMMKAIKERIWYVTRKLATRATMHRIGRSKLYAGSTDSGRKNQGNMIY